MYRYASKDAVLRAHKTGEVLLPNEVPSGMSESMFRIMIGLLDPNPKTRLKISHLYYMLSGEVIELTEAVPVVLEPKTPDFWDRSYRSKTIDALYELNTNMNGKGKTFTLALNILDRYVERKNIILVPTDEPVLRAALMVAEMVLFPDFVHIRDRHVRKAVVDILGELNFELFTETCDGLLEKEHQLKVDYGKLKEVLKDTMGSTRQAVCKYRQISRKRFTLRLK